MHRWLTVGLALSLLLVGAQTPSDEEVVWLDFIAWWRAQPRTVEDPRPGYCALKRLGSDECTQRFLVLKRKSREHYEDDHAALFDRIYRDQTPSFRTTPSQLVVNAVEGVEAGSALDVHMGQGRNAIFLATKGWKVTGFDISAEAISAAKASAAKAGVVVDARREGHDRFDFGQSRWDLIVMAYPWLPLDDPALIDRIFRSLRPNGRLVFEHYRRPSCQGAEKGEWVPCANEILKLFQRLRITFYQETMDLPDWSSKRAEVVRMIAQMPGDGR